MTKFLNLRNVAAIVACLAVSVFFVENVAAQAKGDNVLSAGIGFGSRLYSGAGYTSEMPALSLTYERFVKDNLWNDKSSLGIGGYLGYTSAQWDYAAYGYGWKYSDFIIGARGAVHYAFIDKLDAYSGIMLGYDIVSAKAIGTFSTIEFGSANASAFVWSWYAGARYYFSNSLAAFAELGYGIAIFNLGVAYKF